MTDDKIKETQGYRDTQEYSGNAPDLTEEERRHAQHIAENYKKILDQSISGHYTDEPVAGRSEVAYPVGYEPVSAQPSPSPDAYVEEGSARTENFGGTYPVADNAARISEYTAHPAPTTKKVLFEGVTYTKGGYMHGPNETLVYADPLPETDSASAPAMEACAESMAPEAVAMPAPETVSDDSIPTPRTMLHRTLDGAEEVPVMRVGFWEALSTKMRVALAAVTTTIFVVAVLICINTAVLENLNADIANKQLRLNELRRSSEQLQEQIDEATDPANVDRWAQENGLVR